MASPDRVKLTPTSYLVLGMVRLGVSSGYGVKKAADASTQNFWPISLALVYPELARLEAGGLLRRRNDAQGGRARSAYRVTAKGEKALTSWLRSPKVAPVQIRDEAMLKLFLADALGEEDQLHLIAGLRERNRERRVELERDALGARGGARGAWDPLRRGGGPPLRRPAALRGGVARTARAEDRRALRISRSSCRPGSRCRSRGSRRRSRPGPGRGSGRRRTRPRGRSALGLGASTCGRS